MRGTNTNKQLLTTTLIAACVLSVLFSVSIFRYMKSVETRYKKERITLVKEKMELKDSFDALSEDVSAKDESIVSLENEKKMMAVEIGKLKQEVDKISGRQAEADESLKRENAQLREMAEGYRKTPLEQFLKDALDSETDQNIKRVLTDAANKIGMIKEGKTVSLAPVVVTNDYSDSQRQGKVISVDRRNGLVVIDVGRMHGVREGARCQLYDGQEKIGSGSIIKTRYKISAAFIDSMQPRHTVQELRVGNSVSVD